MKHTPHSRITVTNSHTGSSVVVRINDRGPFVRGRVIDQSPAADVPVPAHRLHQPRGAEVRVHIRLLERFREQQGLRQQ